MRCGAGSGHLFSGVILPGGADFARRFLDGGNEIQVWRGAVPLTKIARLMQVKANDWVRVQSARHRAGPYTPVDT